MELTRRQGSLLALAVLLAMALLLMVRLAAYGILDPWELATADQARDIAAGKSVPLEGQPPLGRLLVAAGFGLFGVSEWAGRVPIALAGLLALAAIHWLVARFAGLRAGLYAVVIAATTPLFLLNARQMLGETPAFLAETLVGLTAASAVFLPTRDPHAPAARRARATLLWLGALVAAAVLAVLARGALVGLLPPLAAVAVAAGFSGLLGHVDPRRSGAAWATTGAAVFVALAVAQEVALDAASYSAWLGGKPVGGEPPTFDVVPQELFHAFAPWTALLIPAMGRMLAPAGGGPEAQLRRVVVLWAAFAYGALTLYLARYGTATWVAIAPLAASVALLLRDVERSRERWWGAAVVAVLFVGLLVRDYDLFPGSPVGGLPIEQADVPDEFNPSSVWAALFGLFGLATVLSLTSASSPGRPDFRAPYRLLAAQWRKGWRFRPWLLLAGLAAAILLGAGAIVLLAPGALSLTTIVRKWAVRLASIAVVLPVAIAAAQAAWWAAGRLGRARALPVLAAGIVAGSYTGHGYLPELSAHYSPRGIYDVYKQFAADGEPLGEYRVGNRAAAYYVKGELRELANQGELIDFLTHDDERRWAVLPASELAAVNRGFRKRTGRHLYVADASSARTVLAANRAIEDHPNENVFAKYVLDEAPETDHPMDVRYADKIELLGYDLDLPHEGYVGAGETITLRWYWKALQPVPGGWQVFVHIDGQGQRVTGDHDPVDGKYPVRLWEKGDLIVDEQELTIPAHFRAGNYQILVGFWRGKDRLDVVEGPEDGDNRVRAGILRVR